MKIPNPLARLGDLADRIEPPGRRRRRIWSGNGRAHIEVKGVHRAELAHVARQVEKMLEELPAVTWALVNPVTGTAVVDFDGDAADLEDLVVIVESVEEACGLSPERFATDRPEHPGDSEPLNRNLIALGADVVGLGASFVGRAVQLTPIPTQVASVVSLVEHQPRLRKFVEHRLGYGPTDLFLGLSGALMQAATQGPLGLIVAAGSRASQVGELMANRKVWEQREPELSGARLELPLEALEAQPRPRPLPAGHIERFADQIGLGSVGLFGMGLLITRDPRRAGDILVAGIPRASSMGREVFAANLGRELSARGMLVLDRAALRRLDRIDAIVLDAATLDTGRLLVEVVEPLGEADTDALTLHARAALEVEQAGGRPDATGWTLVPINELEPASAARSIDRDRLAQQYPSGVRALVHGGQVMGLAGLVRELDPVGEALANSALASGHRLVLAGADGHFGERIRADETIEHGGDLATTIRELQNRGHGVLVVSAAAEHDALWYADFGVGIAGAGAEAPWGADVVTARGLEDAWLVVEASRSAREVSRRSALLSLAGSSVGATWAMIGLRGGSTRRAALPVNAAALVAEGVGLASAVAVSRRRPAVASSTIPWHAIDADTVFALVGSSSRGLDEDEVRARRPPPPVRVSRLGQVARAIGVELANPLTPILGLGAGLAAATGSASDAVLVGATVVANGMLSGAQRLRTELSIEHLNRASQTLVTARRHDKLVEVAPDTLVRGDVVSLAPGDVVPADCRILEAEGCEVDESAVTGESLPVVKQAMATPGAPVAERNCMLYASTTIVAGSALGVVVGIGSDTESGRALAGAPEPPPSGVEVRLAKLTKAVLPVTIAGGAAVTGFGLLRGRSVSESVGTGVSLMVAAVPEGLPMLATVAQLSAAQRLSHHNALVRNPRTIEALGRVDVLCFDKTGTLTAGRIAVQRVSDGVSEAPLDVLSPSLRAVLAAALRASPTLADDEDTLPHATDQAVIEAAEHVGVSASDGLARWHQVGELPFESAKWFHATVGRAGERTVVSVKGAPESVLPRCDRWHSPSGDVQLTPKLRSQLENQLQLMATKGLRVLAVAERDSSARIDIDESRVTGMTMLGYLGLADHVRPTAAAAVDGLRRAGVDIVMLTGDHPATAEAIAEELSILNGHRIVTGTEIDAMDDQALAAAVADVAVFARVTPAHKVRIVGALQELGRVVAMTGDGANDAPAIRLANTGIALGRHGATAARDAADLVVADDRIETIIDAIVEGRAMWSSVRDALAILLGGNLGEIAFTVGATALTGASPLNARQLLLVNMLTDMLPAMAIASRPPAQRSPESLLHEGPEASLGAALIRQVGLRAATTAAGAGGAWLVARGTGTGRRAGTVALAALVGTQLAQTAVAGGSSPAVLASTAVSAAALVAIVQTPVVSQFFGCTPLGPVAWTIAGTSSVAATATSVVVPWAVGRIRASADGP